MLLPITQIFHAEEPGTSSHKYRLWERVRVPVRAAQKVETDSYTLLRIRPFKASFRHTRAYPAFLRLSRTFTRRSKGLEGLFRILQSFSKSCKAYQEPWRLVTARQNVARGFVVACVALANSRSRGKRSTTGAKHQDAGKIFTW